MIYRFIFASLLYSSVVSSFAESHEFRTPEEPGHRESIGEDDEIQTPEQLQFLNCAMGEYLELEYVEACAVFKQKHRRYLECRYVPDTYDRISTERLTSDGDKVGDICAQEAFDTGRSAIGRFFSNLWTSIFGED